MRRYAVKISQQAISSLNNIYHYIAEDNHIMADIVIRTILNTIEGHLSYFPYSGKIINDKRRIFVETTFRYTILYLFNEENIFIVDVKKYQSL